MIGDPRDRTAYAIAFAGLGLAFVVVLAGICWLATHVASTGSLTHRCALHASGQCSSLRSFRYMAAASVPPGLWAALVALGGVLVGALIPFPSWVEPSGRRGCGHSLWRAVLFLAPIAILALAVAELPHTVAKAHLEELAIAALLLGLLIPSPARGD